MFEFLAAELPFESQVFDNRPWVLIHPSCQSPTSNVFYCPPVDTGVRSKVDDSASGNNDSQSRTRSATNRETYQRAAEKPCTSCHTMVYKLAARMQHVCDENDKLKLERAQLVNDRTELLRSIENGIKAQNEMVTQLRLRSTPCPVCLEEKCNTTLKCGHHIHSSCLASMEALAISQTCPLCRYPIREN